MVVIGSSMADTGGQQPLFPATPGKLQALETHLKPGSLTVWPAVLGEPAATQLAASLHKDLAWEQPRIHLFGKWHTVPRLQVWMGNPGARYRYSGLQLEPEPWHPGVAELRRKVEAMCNTRFNSVLLNLYRDGSDAMGWHSDDEDELGPEPWIASYSLGCSRRFCLRSRDSLNRRHELQLAHDQLLLMSPGVQEGWQHALPRSRKVHGWRINLTFRQVRPGP